MCCVDRLNLHVRADIHPGRVSAFRPKAVIRLESVWTAADDPKPTLHSESRDLIMMMRRASHGGNSCVKRDLGKNGSVEEPCALLLSTRVTAGIVTASVSGVGSPLLLLPPLDSKRRVS
jgi:hypothetical protein